MRSEDIMPVKSGQVHNVNEDTAFSQALNQPLAHISRLLRAQRPIWVRNENIDVVTLDFSTSIATDQKSFASLLNISQF